MGPDFETLKEILRHARDPSRLDEHPWTRALFVREVLAANPGLQGTSPGEQLVGALAELFRKLQPASPPRQGLRLDPRWGEFGLLAALYFAPFNHGKPFPRTQLEAWRQIDPAILFFVYGQPAEELGPGQVETYRLVGAELEFGAASTLSDWHRKGLGRLAEAVLNRERYLSRLADEASPLLGCEGGQGEGEQTNLAPMRREFALKRSLSLLLIAGLLLGCALAGVKAWKVYEQGRLVYEKAAGLRSLLRGPLDLETLGATRPRLAALQNDWAAFREETRPLLGLAPALGWLPAYGGDLAYAPQLGLLGDHVLEASLLASEAAGPLVERLQSSGGSPDPAELASLLVEAQPGLARAREALDEALAVRASMRVERLSPRLQSLLVDELDPLLSMADQGLSLASALPSALGATAEGPKTYLLLAQNEDELRPTGGFITSVGKLVLHDGRVISLEFEGVDSGIQEDWSKPYPVAPWQLQEYMNSRVLILRDANWFSDYPTSALWVEYLYAYKHSHSLDGVIAFDQHFLVMLLAQLGALEVEGAPYPLTADNVVAYMRAAKQPPEGETRPPDWYRKEFIDQIARALLEKVYAGEQLDPRALAGALARALAERHLLLQFDDPQLAALLAGRGWDNAVRAGPGDYLMLTDTNVGFNKTNAVVEVRLAYDVDLTDLAAPRSSLVVTHRNKADPQVPCIHWNTGEITLKESYPVNRCYWNYLRVYKQAGVELLEASPHAIPGDRLLLGRGVPARVDELEEELPGVRGFGTLLVVPGGESWNTRFRFALPTSVIEQAGGAGGWRYRLKVQKQPGTLAIPLTLRVHLPARATLVSTSMDAVRQGQDLLVQTDLRTDVELEVAFTLP
jgi:hypothetical protein